MPSPRVERLSVDPLLVALLGVTSLAGASRRGLLLRKPRKDDGAGAGAEAEAEAGAEAEAEALASAADADADADADAVSPSFRPVPSSP